jgi:hypothetical protein
MLFCLGQPVFYNLNYLQICPFNKIFVFEFIIKITGQIDTYFNKMGMFYYTLKDNKKT